MIVEGKVLLELESVEHITKAHKKQVLTYLRLTGLRLGYQPTRSCAFRDYANLTKCD